jgi:glycosyltransferase involved in cell wall biosynthesis
LGIVFLEAMALKVPVIGTNIGAIPEFIHDGRNGYLVEPGNHEQISDKICNLLNSRDNCMIFGEYGYNLFWELYTWDKTGIRMREHINSVLSSLT